MEYKFNIQIENLFLYAINKAHEFKMCKNYIYGSIGNIK